LDYQVRPVTYTLHQSAELSIFYWAPTQRYRHCLTAIFVTKTKIKTKKENEEKCKLNEIKI